jgi:hypothetical protein
LRDGGAEGTDRGESMAVTRNSAMLETEEGGVSRRVMAGLARIFHS